MAIRAFHTAASGMTAQQFLVDATANNLANINTTGFKRQQVAFEDLIYLNLLQPGTEQLQGTAIPTGLQIGNGVRVSGTTGVFTQGTLENTGRSLDVSIDGPGFFEVTFPDGTNRYTRDGGLQLNADNQLVTSDGFQLQPAITIPNDTVSIAISSDGTVSVTTGGDPTGSTVVGQLTLVTFPNPAGLSREGNNLLRETPASGAPVASTPGENGAGLIRQAFLERSNVEPVQELVNLLLAQRAYEFNTRAVRVADEMLAATSDLVR